MLRYSTLNFKSTTYSQYLQEEIYNLLDRTFNIPENYTFNIFEVTREYIARPDLISYDAYGDTMFGDIICKLNGISNPFELNEGMYLIIPSPEDIMDFARKAPASEKESGVVEGKGNEQIVPVAKTKQSKRQANEAIVGDSRFKIDSASGIIIY